MTAEDVVYRCCNSCGWVHKVVESTGDSKEDSKYSHCCNCYEDYLNFKEATTDDLTRNRHRNIGKILAD